jgi:hypothetical protein
VTGGHAEFRVPLRPARYDGYRAFSWPRPGIDYEPIELAPAFGRVPLYDLGLDEGQWERVIRLIDENIVIEPARTPAAVPRRHVPAHRELAKGPGATPLPLTAEYEPVEYVAGLENPTENFVNIVGWLVEHGYSDADIVAVTGGNVMRVLERTWGPAKAA